MHPDSRVLAGSIVYVGLLEQVDDVERETERGLSGETNGWDFACDNCVFDLVRVRRVYIVRELRVRVRVMMCREGLSGFDGLWCNARVEGT